MVEVVRTYLELSSPDQLRAAPVADTRVRFVCREGIAAGDYRQLYEHVGAEWHWHDRDEWSDDRLGAYLAQDKVSVFEAMVGDESAGYFELVGHDDGSVEIAYFGLKPAFTGRGLGKAMLARAAQEAWARHPTRVWLHTCTLDSPAALPNYLARGFLPVKTERYVVPLPG
ncbi:MAG TPA: GNAT family N-acetyltransferase [Gemmatimonadaceae bacterium]|nr:GNAT family N-acetyltransferase [Gemmatimonadaceae bacterium]